MKPNIYLSASLSLFSHLMVVVVALFIVKHSKVTELHRPYVVSIVTEMPVGQSSAESSPAPQRETHTVEPKVTSPPKEPTVKKETVKPNSQTSDRIVQDRINELMAKKRIRDLVAMRNSIDLSGSARRAEKSRSHGAVTGAGGSNNRADYLAMVRAKIMERWLYPDTIDRDLEAIVAIRINRDGSVQLIALEKSSGNRLFDRSAISAINSVHRLPPPPDGIEEIGIRFKP